MNPLGSPPWKALHGPRAHQHEAVGPVMPGGRGARTVRVGVCVTPPLAQGQVAGLVGGRGRAAEQTLTTFRPEFWGPDGQHGDDS